jgi:DNA-binding transcriptional regulator YbjK
MSDLGVDLTPLTTALAKVVEEMVRKMIKDTVPNLIKPQAEEALKAMLPGLMERAIAEEKVLIKETLQEITRQALPDVVKPIVDQLAKEIIEKMVWQVVPDHAEAAVRKEIARLTAEV